MASILSLPGAGGLLGAVETAIGALCDGTDPGVVSGADALDGLARLTVAARRSAAVQTSLAVRVVESNMWQGRGSPTAPMWMAKQLGCTTGAAHRVLDTARKLDDLPVTRDAVMSGAISADEANAIVAAATVDPSAESALLAIAVKDHDLASTRKAADKVRHQCRSAAQEQARLERIRKNRRWHEYVDSEDGAAGVKACFMPADYAGVKAILDAFTDQVSATARKAGTRDSATAYRSDAFLAAMAAAGTTLGITPTHADRPAVRTDEPFPVVGASQCDDPSHSSDPDSSPGPTVEPDMPGDGAPVGKVNWNTVVLVDAIALQRGYAAPGETCTIAGIGDVPVAWAKELLGDRVFEVLAHNGTDIVTYASSTRHRPRPVELAVNIRDRTCIVPGCTSDQHVEYDHRDNYAEVKRTDYQNLGLLCPRHHDEKTHRGARLERHDNHWHWHPPPTGRDPDSGADADPDASSDAAEPWSAPVGEHLTNWNLDQPPDPPCPHTDTTARDGDGSSHGTPGRPDDPDPPTLFGDAAQWELNPSGIEADRGSPQQ
jgi:hypothetical protein